MNIEKSSGVKFLVLLANDYIGYRTVYILNKKSWLAENFFREYADYLHNETGQQNQTFRADNTRREFMGHSFRCLNEV
jgi:hypothetical protein